MSFSIWQIAVFVLPVVLFIAAYFTTGRDDCVNRMAFFIRILLLLIAGAAITFLTSNPSGNTDFGALVVLIGGFVIGYLSLRFHILRLQDIRWSPFFALLSYAPIVNLIFVLVLLFVPGKPKVTPDVFS